MKSTRWVQAKTYDYDGEDWGGDEYDEYEPTLAQPTPPPLLPPVQNAPAKYYQPPPPVPGISRMQTFDSSQRSGMQRRGSFERGDDGTVAIGGFRSPVRSTTMGPGPLAGYWGGSRSSSPMSSPGMDNGSSSGGGGGGGLFGGGLIKGLGGLIKGGAQSPSPPPPPPADTKPLPQIHVQQYQPAQGRPYSPSPQQIYQPNPNPRYNPTHEGSQSSSAASTPPLPDFPQPPGHTTSPIEGPQIQVFLPSSPQQQPAAPVRQHSIARKPPPNSAGNSRSTTPKPMHTPVHSGDYTALVAEQATTAVALNVGSIPVRTFSVSRKLSPGRGQTQPGSVSLPVTPEPRGYEDVDFERQKQLRREAERREEEQERERIRLAIDAEMRRAREAEEEDERKREKERIEREREEEEERERERQMMEKAMKEKVEKMKWVEEQRELQRREEENGRRRLAEEETEKQRLASEEAERQRITAEIAKEEEAERKRLAVEEAERQRLAAEEAERQRLAAEEEAERQRLAVIEAERIAEEEEAARQAAIEEDRRRAEEARIAEEARLAEVARIEAEKQAAEEEAERQRIAVEKEAERQRAAAEQAERIRRDEEQRRAAEAEIERQRLALLEAERRAAEETERKAAKEAEREEAEKKAAKRRAAEEAERKAAEEAERKAVEETERKAAEEAELERQRLQAEEERLAAQMERKAYQEAQVAEEREEKGEEEEEEAKRQAKLAEEGREELAHQRPNQQVDEMGKAATIIPPTTPPNVAVDTKRASILAPLQQGVDSPTLWESPRISVLNTGSPHRRTGSPGVVLAHEEEQIREGDLFFGSAGSEEDNRQTFFDPSSSATSAAPTPPPQHGEDVLRTIVVEPPTPKEEPRTPPRRTMTSDSVNSTSTSTTPRTLIRPADTYTRMPPPQDRGRPRDKDRPTLLRAGSASSIDSEGHFTTEEAAQRRRDIQRSISRERVKSEIVRIETMKHSGTPDVPPMPSPWPELVPRSLSRASGRDEEVSAQLVKKPSFVSEGVAALTPPSRQDTSEERTEIWARGMQQENVVSPIPEGRRPKLPGAWVTDSSIGTPGEVANKGNIVICFAVEIGWDKVGLWLIFFQRCYHN